MTALSSEYALEHRMFRVDAHHHLWDLAVRDQPWIDGAALAPLRRSFAVEDLRATPRAASIATVVVQTVTVPEETPDLLALAASSELIAGVVGWVDLTAPDVADALAGARARVARGHPPPGAGRARSALALPRRRARRAARRRRRRPRLRPAHDPAAAAGGDRDRARARRPGVRRRPPLQAADRERASSSRGRRRCARWRRTRTSSASSRGWSPRPTGSPGRSTTCGPYADIVLDAFGPDRVMFGSDWPVCTLAASYEQVRRRRRGAAVG